VVEAFEGERDDPRALLFFDFLERKTGKRRVLECGAFPPLLFLKDERRESVALPKGCSFQKHKWRKSAALQRDALFIFLNTKFDFLGRKTGKRRVLECGAFPPLLFLKDERRESPALQRDALFKNKSGGKAPHSKGMLFSFS